VITFKRAVTGQTSGALFVIGIAVFALTALDPVLGPIAAVIMAMGVLAAIGVWWQRSRATHPSIREDDAENEDRTPIEPK
jgi:hypothetical protein